MLWIFLSYCKSVSTKLNVELKKPHLRSSLCKAFDPLLYHQHHTSCFFHCCPRLLLCRMRFIPSNYYSKIQDCKHLLNKTLGSYLPCSLFIVSPEWMTAKTIPIYLSLLLVILLHMIQVLIFFFSVSHSFLMECPRGGNMSCALWTISFLLLSDDM